MIHLTFESRIRSAALAALAVALAMVAAYAVAASTRADVTAPSNDVAPRPGGTDEDYRFAAAMPGRIDGLMARADLQAHWIGAGRLWYRVQLGGGSDRREYVLVDAAARHKEPLFDHAALATFLAGRLGRNITPDRLPIDRVEVTPDAGTGGHDLAVTILVAGGQACRLLRSGAGGEEHWEELPPDARTAFESALSPTLQRSGPAGDSIMLRLENRSRSVVTLAWIDADGHRHDYGQMAPGSTRAQQTFAGHAWAFYDDHDQLLGSFIAPDASTIVPIDDRPRSESAPRPPSSPNPHPSPEPSPTPSSSAAVERIGGHADALPSAPPRFHCRTVGTNVEVLDETDRIVAATTDGTEDRRYGEPFLWSPDGRMVLVTRRAPAQRHPIHLIESSPRGRTEPVLHELDYLKPGDRIEQSWPVLIDAAAGTVRETTCSADGTSLYANPWSIDHVAWDPDGRGYSFLYNQRGHQVLRVIHVDAASGAAKAIIEERSATFIDYAGKFLYERFEDTSEILWMSERDGWNHLYLIDARDGTIKSQVTRGPWAVRSVDRIDRERREIIVRAGGIDPSQDPYHVHVVRVGFDGSGFTPLTQGDGTHELDWSPDRSLYIDRWSRVDLPPIVELRRGSDGALLLELERGDWSGLVATGWTPPERFVAKGRDGTTDIWGVLWRPSTRPGDPERWSGPLPVIENIYAGPQSAFVPKSFRPWHGQRELAELGFIVVQIDGMGTSQRSKAFHDVCWKNLKDAGFPDRVLWLRAAAATHPQMDLSRVGIYGGSAGGQNALRALIDHNDVYSACVADCGCHDNRMDKVWWNELWMGWPVDDSYVASSNVADAAKLRGSLLLTVGELDRNVDPASTMQVVDALVRADKDFDLLVLPGMGHGAGESPYGKRRRADFFVRHLMGVEPRRPAAGGAS